MLRPAGAAARQNLNIAAAVNTVNSAYKNQDCKPYHDFREVMARKDIDTVMAHQSDLVEVVYTLKQIVCVKGYGEKK